MSVICSGPCEGLFLLISAWIARMNVRALQAILRDASGHPSPNQPIPEAAVAGALRGTVRQD